MNKTLQRKGLSALVALMGAVLTYLNWDRLKTFGSFSLLQSFAAPVFGIWGLTFVFFRVTGPEDKIVRPDGSVGYPPPPMGARVLLVLGLVAGLANWYLMSHFK